MNADIYRSTKHRNAFLFVRAGANPESVPKKVKERIWPVEHFRQLSLIPNSPLIGADPNEVIRNLRKQGYHVQGVRISTNVSEGGAALGAGLLVASLGGGPVGAAIGALIGYWLAHTAEEDQDAT